ncbi:DUF4870 domain-containing protein [Halosimplex salinum]|uniref:DUF4870 domain-containing protein n=1 Tax=Halosimplex salinum TaxID=1710538 RepID=UPI0019D220E6|nr:DUF4870 domain-containing protein [Halosimplex salinum]
MSDEQPDGSDPSENGQSTDDQSVEERTVDGQTVEGQSTGGQSVEGQSTGGQSADGQPAENGSTDEQSTDGQSTGGQSTGGQSTGGQSTEDRSAGQTGGQSTGQTGGQSAGQPSGQTAGQSGGQSGQTVQRGDSMTGPAAGGTDLEPNVAAAIAYVVAPLTGVLMLLLEGDEDDFVRFHSIQSIGFGVAVIGVYIVIGMIVGVLTAIPFVGDFFALLVLPLNGFVGLAAFVGWALLILKAHQGERYALPIIGPIAASN